MAALRGVEVKLILPAKSDHLYMKWMSEAFYRTLLLSGVRIFEYEDSFLHAKTLMIDDWVTVGSTNLNHRSLIHDLEVDVVLFKAASRNTLELQFEKDLKKSHEMKVDTFRISRFSRLIQWILSFFRFYV
jgi:cardiolipin synthase